MRELIQRVVCRERFERRNVLVVYNPCLCESDLIYWVNLRLPAQGRFTRQSGGCRYQIALRFA